jgi:hypothetical protein
MRSQEKQPGLLIFRQENNRVLFIFVAGETPTAGVNPYQFRAARAYMRAFGDPKTIKIQGPTFSGSFFSLTQLINLDQQLTTAKVRDHIRYVVRTGTASNDYYAIRFIKDAHAAVDFAATNANTADQAADFCKILNDFRIPSDQAAILIEDQTGYAMGYSDRRCEDGAIEVLHFPREISHLRNVYRDTAAASHAENTPQPAIDFSLKDPESGEDSIPVFSSTHTPISQYAVIAEITNEIRRDRIRMVQLGATNVLDSLFLAKVLKQQCPDIWLLITHPDLLFVQEAQAASLTGTLALSSYPLFFGAKHWFGERSFTQPDANSEGVYNATLLLLKSTELSNYSWKSQGHPASWLMTLNRNGFSPVQAMKTEGSPWYEEVRSDAGPTLRLPQTPRSWVLLTSVLAIFSLLFTGWIAYLHCRPQTLLWSTTNLDRGYAADSCRLFCLLSALLILSAMLGILWIPLARYTLAHAGTRCWGIQALAFLGFGCPLLLSLGLIHKRLWLPSKPAPPKALFKTPRDCRARRITVVFLVLAYAFVLAAWSLCCYYDSGNSSAFFFSFRALELQPGSSPALPILSILFALLLFCLFHITRLYFAARQRPRLFTYALDQIFPGRVKKYRREISRILLAPMNLSPRKQLTWAGASLLLLAALGALCRVDINLSSVDGRTYDSLLLALLAALILTIFGTCLQVRATWASLQGLLTTLNSLPISTAFTRLSDPGTKSPIWVRRLNLKSIDIPLRSSMVLHNMRLINMSESGGANLQTEVISWLKIYGSAVRRLLKEEKDKENHALRVPFGKRNLQQHISSIFAWPGANLPGKEMRTERISRTDLRSAFCSFWYASASLSHEVCDRILVPEWRTRFLAWKPAPTSSDPDQSFAKKIAVMETGGQEAYELARGFVALQYAMFIVYTVRQIQNLLWSLSLGFVLLVIALSSYNFQSPQLIKRSLLVIFVVLGYVSWKCMSQMERDPILSRLAGTAAGELNKDFYFKLMGYGALPVLGLLASQFPSISNFLFSWVQPTLEAFR